MINVHEALIDQLDEKELYLLLHIAKRMNKDNGSTPGNELLMNETGWGKEKLSKVKRSLSKKGMIEIQDRFNEKGIQLQNRYKIKTNMIGFYWGAKKVNELYPPENPTPTQSESNKTYPPENPTPIKSTPPKIRPQSINKYNSIVEFENSTVYYDVILHLNKFCETKYRASTKSTQRLIKARVREGFTLSDFKKVIEAKARTWMGTQMQKFLRPQTLFGNKFESYLQEYKEPESEAITDEKWKPNYKNYTDWVKEEFPLLCQTVRILSYNQFFRFKERNYVRGLSIVGNGPEMRCFERCHKMMNDSEQIRGRYQDVFAYHLEQAAELAKMTATI